jgi:hypothetical protein
VRSQVSIGKQFNGTVSLHFFYKYVEIKPKKTVVSKVVGFFVEFLGGHSQSPKLLSCQPLEATRGSDLDVQALGGYQ